jgi:DNA-binding transcriptional ArsR family regulator
MSDETYIVASLEDAKARELGQIMSNENSRAILSLLAKKNATQSEISQELKIPLPTVDYNMKQLMKSGMITINGTFYSKKGNKINVYTLAKKFILIAPKGVSISASKIKSILPAALITLGAGGIIKLFYSMQPVRMAATAEKAASAEALAAPSFAASPSAWQNLSTHYALFFIAGALAALGIYLIFNWRRR